MNKRTTHDLRGSGKELTPKQRTKNLFKQYESQIKEALPRHLSAERMMRVINTAVLGDKKLMECHPATIIGSVVQCAQLGLEPNTPLGHAYLVPFKNRKQQRTDCQIIIGYKGLIDLARRSGQIRSLEAHAVRENDRFSYEYGTSKHLRFRPAEGARGPITHFFAIAEFTDGGYQFEVMTKADVDLVMRQSQSKGEYGPWKDHYEEMGRKTPIRKLAKYLPLNVEFATAVSLDEAADDQRDQGTGRVLEGEFGPDIEPPEPERPEEEPLVRRNESDSADSPGEGESDPNNGQKSEQKGSGEASGASEGEPEKESFVRQAREASNLNEIDEIRIAARETLDGNEMKAVTRALNQRQKELDEADEPGGEGDEDKWNF